MTREVRDYILIRELYKCSPSDLANSSEQTLNLHYQMLATDQKQRERQENAERIKQKAKTLAKKS